MKLASQIYICLYKIFANQMIKKVKIVGILMQLIIQSAPIIQ